MHFFHLRHLCFALIINVTCVIRFARVLEFFIPFRRLVRILLTATVRIRHVASSFTDIFSGLVFIPVVYF